MDIDKKIDEMTEKFRRELRKMFSFPDHKGRPGERGGSLPRGEGGGDKVLDDLQKQKDKDIMPKMTKSTPLHWTGSVPWEAPETAKNGAWAGANHVDGWVQIKKEGGKWQVKQDTKDVGEKGWNTWKSLGTFRTFNEAREGARKALGIKEKGTWGKETVPGHDEFFGNKK